MAKRQEPQDEALRILIAEALGAHLEEDEAEFAATLVDSVMDKLKPVIGAAAERRRNEGALRDSFREGFRTGQQAGRWARWHSMIWKHSAFARELHDAANDGLAKQGRYSHYNYDN